MVDKDYFLFLYTALLTLQVVVVATMAVGSEKVLTKCNVVALMLKEILLN